MDIKNDRIAMMFVWKLDRLIRNNIKNEELFLLFEKHNVKVISVTENHLDFTTADGRANIRRKGVDNQYESERTSERTSGSLKTSAEMGDYSKSIIPLGYKRIHNDYKAAPKVKYIFEKMYTEKIGIHKMLDWLNSNHYLKNKWSEDVLLTLVKNKIYIGVYQNTLRNPTVVIKNHTPKLLSAELFYGLQDDLKKRYKAVNKYKYDFKGYVYCKECCKGMKAQPAKNGKSKNVYLYYFCPSCKKRINHNKLYEEIQDDLNIMLLQLLDTSSVNESMKKLERIQYLIEKNDDNLVNSLIDESFHEQKEIELLAKRINIIKLIDTQSKRKTKWENLDYSGKRSFLKKYMNKFEVTIENTNNYKVNIILKKQ